MLAQSRNVLVQDTYRGTPIFAATYTPHGPLNISSDADFVAHGWNGTGTEVDPYAISGLSFDTGNPIRVENTSAYFSIADCMFSYSADMGGAAITIRNATNGIIESCIFERYSNAFIASYSSNTRISTNTIRDCQFGVTLDKTYNIQVVSNTIDRCTGGMQLSCMVESQITSNTVFNCQRSGIETGDNGSGSVVFHNEIYDIGHDTLVAAAISVGGFDWTVQSNAIHDSSTGISNGLLCKDFNITENNIYNCGTAVAMQPGDNLTIQLNTIDNCTGGISLIDNHQTQVIGNTITASRDGLSIELCRECRIAQNHLQNSSFSLFGVAPSEYRDDVDGNTINGRQVGYFMDERDARITSADYAQIYIVNCTHVEIRNQNLIGTYTSIIMAFSKSCGIVNSTISNSRSSNAGISFYYTEDCYATDCTLTHNDCFTAMYLQYANNTEISRNLICGNNGDGIDVYDSSYSTIYGNLITNNSVVGVSLIGLASHSRVYGNEIGWNGMYNALDDGFSNSWDDGISLGNGWSNYNSTVSDYYEINGNAKSRDNFPTEYMSWSLSLPRISSNKDIEVIALSIIGVSVIVGIVLLVLRRKKIL